MYLQPTNSRWSPPHDLVQSALPWNIYNLLILLRCERVLHTSPFATVYSSLIVSGVRVRKNVYNQLHSTASSTLSNPVLNSPTNRTCLRGCLWPERECFTLVRPRTTSLLIQTGSLSKNDHCEGYQREDMLSMKLGARSSRSQGGNRAVGSIPRVSEESRQCRVGILEVSRTPRGPETRKSARIMQSARRRYASPIRMHPRACTQSTNVTLSTGSAEISPLNKIHGKLGNFLRRTKTTEPTRLDSFKFDD